MAVRRTLLIVVVWLWMGASPAFAVSGITVTTPTSAAAGARTDYVASFTNGGPLSGTQTISVTFPAGTTFTGFNGSVAVGGTAQGSCATPTPAGSVTSVCSLFGGRSIAAGATVAVSFGGIVNGAAGGGKIVSVVTSTDASANSPAFTLVAANPVSAVSVSNLTPSRAAGALTSYAVGFTTSATGGLSAAAGSEISVTFASGTTFGAWNGANVLVAGVAIGSCSKPVAATPLLSVCSLFGGRAIAPSTAVQIAFNGVTNGSAGTGKTVSVTTTSDTPASTPGSFDVVAGDSVTQPAVDIATPSAAAGAVTQYTVGFATSTTGGLSADAGSQISVDFPTGTTFGGWNGASVLVAGVVIGSCSKPVAATPLRSVCSLFGGRAIAASTPVQIKLFGVTNGAAGNGKTLTVSTTSDLPAVVSAPFDVVAGNAVSQPGVVISAPSEAAGAQTAYVVSFSTSATGGMSADAASAITVNFPTGTAFGGWNGASVLVAGTVIGSCSKPVAATPLTSTCTLFGGRAIAPSTAVQIVFYGVTSPATVATDKTVTVSTTSDLPVVTSTQFRTVAGGAVTQPTVAIGAPSAAAGALTTYAVAFSTSATGGLAADAASTITVVFPPGTTFAAWNGATVSVAGAVIGSCSKPVAASPLTSACSLFGGRTIAASTAVQIAFNGVTSGAAGTGKTLTVTTTSDLPVVTSAGFAVVAAHTIGPVAVTAATDAPSTTTDYVVGFATSSTGGLAADAGSQIVLNFPTGTTFAAWNGATVSVGGTTVGSCSKPQAAAPLTSSCTLFGGRTIAAGATVQIVLHSVTNPSSAGPYTLVASTTSDPQPVTSGAYASGPAATIDSGPSGTTIDPAPSFTFSGGTAYECRIDAAAFAPCTSPYSPGPLQDGEHTFSVRAVGGQPATRTFTVARPSPGGGGPGPAPTPTPSPGGTPAPTPAPTPVPGKSVVVQPVSGKVLVKKPGSNQFVEVDASEGIPLGSTVDTRAGVIQLTAKAGQAADFSDGIFTVTQSGATTDLTLTEPLAPCGKGAKAAAKKPKTRKLWGDGTGAFRTRGQYSAATVRGTRWLVQDSCSGTLTKVAKGVVSVRDQVKKKTLLVKAGHSYLAKPRG